MFTNISEIYQTMIHINISCRVGIMKKALEKH